MLNVRVFVLVFVASTLAAIIVLSRNSSGDVSYVEPTQSKDRFVDPKTTNENDDDDEELNVIEKDFDEKVQTEHHSSKKMKDWLLKHMTDLPGIIPPPIAPPFTGPYSLRQTLHPENIRNFTSYFWAPEYKTTPAWTAFRHWKGWDFSLLPKCNWSYPPTPPRPLDWFSRHMANKLKFVADTLNRNKIPFWAAYGTLLGIFRHRGQTPLDTDVDLAVPLPFQQQAIEALLEASSKPGCPYNITRVYEGNISCRTLYHRSAKTYTCRTIVASPNIIKKCHDSYDESYPHVLAVDYPWPLDIHFPQARHSPARLLKCEAGGLEMFCGMPSHFCKCNYYDTELPCPQPSEYYIQRVYRDWHQPWACRSLPKEWCSTVGQYTSDGETVPVISIRGGEPSTDPDALSKMGFYPWVRVSDSKTWCKQPKPKSTYVLEFIRRAPTGKIIEKQEKIKH